jgi:hypothetical protein
MVGAAAQTPLAKSLDWDWTAARKLGFQLWEQCSGLVSCFCLTTGPWEKFPLETVVVMTKLVSGKLVTALFEQGEMDRHCETVLWTSVAAAQWWFQLIDPPQTSEMLPLSFHPSFPSFSVVECALESVGAFDCFPL